MLELGPWPLTHQAISSRWSIGILSRRSPATEYRAPSPLDFGNQSVWALITKEISLSPTSAAILSMSSRLTDREAHSQPASAQKTWRLTIQTVSLWSKSILYSNLLSPDTTS